MNVAAGPVRARTGILDSTYELASLRSLTRVESELAAAVRQLDLNDEGAFMRTYVCCLAFAVSLNIIMVGCKKDQPTQPSQEPFSGILITDASCSILGGDTTDFLPRPTTAGGFPGMPTNYSLIKACPNPVTGDTITIEFQIPADDSIRILAFATTNAAPVATILNQRLPAGVFRVLWGFAGPNGVYRVQMYAGNGFTAYGDVEFK